MRKLTFYTFQQAHTNTASSQSQSMGRTLSKSNRKGGGQAGKSNTVMKKKNILSGQAIFSILGAKRYYRKKNRKQKLGRRMTGKCEEEGKKKQPSKRNF